VITHLRHSNFASALHLIKTFKNNVSCSFILHNFQTCLFTELVRHTGACCYSVQNLLSSRLLSKNLKIKIYRTIILPVVLCGCETWSLTLREERKLRVFEKKVLRRIFGPSRDEVKREWRRLHNEELNDLYSSPNIVRVIKSRRMRWAGHVARMGEERECIGSWWGNRRKGDHLGDLGVDGWIILGWISRRWDVGIWTGLDWPR